MSVHIKTQLQKGCAIVGFTNLQVNSLSHATAQAIRNELIRINSNSEINAVILTGSGKFFSAGADIEEFDSDPKLVPQLRALMSQLDLFSKPLITAINGPALGGGFPKHRGGPMQFAEQVGFKKVRDIMNQYCKCENG